VNQESKPRARGTDREEKDKKKRKEAKSIKKVKRVKINSKKNLVTNYQVKKINSK